MIWHTLPDKYPPAHAKFLVVRDGIVYTATPCYGIHSPWWVVRIMGDGPATTEAEPVSMRNGDRWLPLADAPFLAPKPEGGA